ncbi:MAG: M20 family metallopeptidase [Desulfobacterales bacterium]|jgi:glutamate carboxypeptidase
MTQMNAISTWLQERLPEFLDDLRALVDVDCGTANKAGVDAVGGLFRDRLRAAGFELTEFPLSDYGDCCLATLRGTGQARILLIGHLDTVYPDGTAAARPMRSEGRRILGPGVSDMKAGLLAGLYAVRALQHIGFNDFGRIDFFVNTEEEVGSPASQQLYRPAAQQADAALVLEAARASGDIVSARKGGGVYHLKVHGRQAHAGAEPEKGANAIVELAGCILELTALNGLHPGTTVNVGIVEGGTRSNVVPDMARADVDVRFAAAEGGQALDRAVRRVGTQPKVPGTRVEISGGIEKGPMEKTAAVAYLVELAQEAAAQLGVTFKDVQTGGNSDGNHMAELGLPVLDGLGPVGGDDHSPSEFLDADSIVPRTALLAGLIAAIATHRDQLAARRT